MAKSKVSFSLELLNSNLKYHKKQIKYLEKVESPKRKLMLDTRVLNNVGKRKQMHLKYFNDLTLAIKNLKKIR